MKNLKDKVVLITGGASGLGAATAKRFDKEGAKVVIADIKEEAGSKLASELNTAAFIKTDVTNVDDVKASINFTVDKFGSLDVLMNNAGIDGDQKPTADSSLDNWKRVIDIDLNGAFYYLKYGLEQMKEQESGVIINTSSTAGLVGFENIPPYTASKGALVQLTKSTAMEYAEFGIRVNAIAPSVVKTDLVEHFIESSDDPEATEEQFNNLNPMPGWIQPEDVAAAVAFLASDDAKYITGHTLPIDGGYVSQ
jgi:NAD(P)-dependent dehydrogenase (short-subunit alcohol dehydrogenase family)